MIRNLGKFGNSLVVVIPRPLADALEWNEDTLLKITIKEGGLFVRAVEPAPDEPSQAEVPTKSSLFRKKISPEGDK